MDPAVDDPTRGLSDTWFASNRDPVEQHILRETAPTGTLSGSPSRLSGGRKNRPVYVCVFSSFPGKRSERSEPKNYVEYIFTPRVRSRQASDRGLKISVVDLKI